MPATSCQDPPTTYLSISNALQNAIRLLDVVVGSLHEVVAGRLGADPDGDDEQGQAGHHGRAVDEGKDGVRARCGRENHVEAEAGHDAEGDPARQGSSVRATRHQDHTSLTRVAMRESQSRARSRQQSQMPESAC